jgi:Holliday junction resolvase RusA-like endonuclease
MPDLIRIENPSPNCYKIYVNLKPIPWGSPRMSRNRAYSRHASYKSFVKAQINKAYRGSFLEGPLDCRMIFFLNNSSKSPWHITKPDRINLGKLMEDILEGIFFKNDSAIISGSVEKVKDKNERVEITLTKIC